MFYNREIEIVFPHILHGGDETIDETRHEPARVLLKNGVKGRSSHLHRFYVEGPSGATIDFTFESERARTISTTATLGG